MPSPTAQALFPEGIQPTFPSDHGDPVVPRLPRSLSRPTAGAQGIRKGDPVSDVQLRQARAVQILKDCGVDDLNRQRAGGRGHPPGHQDYRQLADHPQLAMKG